MGGRWKFRKCQSLNELRTELKISKMTLTLAPRPNPRQIFVEIVLSAVVMIRHIRKQTYDLTHVASVVRAERLA